MSPLPNDNGHRRPMPPLDSRQTVLTQSAAVDEWVSVDDSDDLQMSMPCKRAKTGDVGITTYPRVYHSQEFSATPKVEHAQDIQHQRSFRDTSFYPQPNLRKRQRTPPRDSFEEIKPIDVRQHNEMRSNHTAAQRRVVNRESAQLGLIGNTIATPTVDRLVWVDDEAESIWLAKITNLDYKAPKVVEDYTSHEFTKSEKESPATDQSMQDVVDYSGSERSRQLRERALARRNVRGAGRASHHSTFSLQTDQAKGASEQEDASVTTTVSSSTPSQRQYDLPLKTIGSVSNGMHTASRNASGVSKVANEVIMPRKSSVAGFDQTSQNNDKTDDHILFIPRINTERDQVQSHSPSPSPAGSEYNSAKSQVPEDAEDLSLPLGLQAYKSQPTSRTTSPSPAFSQEGEITELTDSTQTFSIQDSKPSSHIDEPSNFQTDDEFSRDDSAQLPATSLSQSIQERQSSPPSANGTKGKDSLHQSLPLFSWGTVPSLVRPTLSHTASTVQVDDQYPQDPPDLSLPKHFDKYDQELQAIVKESETLKERERDLIVILPTFKLVAQLAVSAELTEQHKSELQTLQQYTNAVVGHGRSGKKIRQRIGQIAQNLRRRLTKYPSIDDQQYQTFFNSLMKDERRRQIEQTLSDLYPKIEQTAKLRSAASDRRHRQKSRAQVKDVTKPIQSTSGENHLDLAPTNTSGFIDPIRTRKKPRYQFLTLDQKENTIREQLVRFLPPETSNTKPLVQYDTDDELQQQDDAEDVSSEEEEGVEFFSSLTTSNPPSHPVPKDTNLVSTTGQSQSENPDPPPPSEGNVASSQRPHDGLASSMQHKYDQAAILQQHNIQEPCMELSSGTRDEPNLPTTLRPSHQDHSQNAHQEFDDLETDLEDSGGTCYRYILKARAFGIQDFTDGEEYMIGKYLRGEEAVKTMEDMKTQLQTWYEHNLRPGEIPALQCSQRNEGLVRDHTLELGRDAQLSLRLWTEKEEYNPSRLAYKQAKVRKACRANPVYTVIWERIVTRAGTPLPAAKAHEDVQKQAAQQQQQQCDKDDGLDDLFDPDPDPPPSPEHTNLSNAPAPITTTSTITLDGLRFFSNIAHANRHAKDVFMQWFMDHLWGSGNSEKIRLEDEAIEKELESYEDKLMWEREEVFDVYEDVEEGGDLADMVEKHGESDGRSSDRRRRRLVENDRYLVKVVMRTVSGPAN